MHKRKLVLLIITAVLLLTLVPATTASATEHELCFPETSQCISGRFRGYWEQNGGLPVFGFPITAQTNDLNPDTGQKHLTQSFERIRFERHSENKAPYDVLLGRLGDDRLRQQGIDWQTEPQASGAQPGCLWFEQTRHNVCNQDGNLGFMAYWQSHGLKDPRLDAYGRSLALFGLPLTEPRMETNANGDTVLTQWFERARFEWHPTQPESSKVLLGLLGREQLTPPERLPSRAPQTGLWISAEELAQLPTSGEAWERMKAAADGDLGTPTVADYIADHDVKTLAVALVYGRTREPAYRQKAAEAIRAVIGTETGGLVVMLGRNLVSYVISADLIDLKTYDPVLDEQFRAWISALRHTKLEDGTLISEHERRANNHGTMPGASRAAIAVYLGDAAELARMALVFRGWVGDRDAYDNFHYRDDHLSWQADPSRPVAINPRDAVKDGRSIDGALPEEMRRGCALQWPPCPTNYTWEGLQGAFVQAMILSRQGYDVWAWQD